MPAIVTSDWHLTSNPRDEYRWGIFDFLQNIPNSEQHDLFILGDLTDAKDHHPSVLVNRLHNCFGVLSGFFHAVILLKGNHDFVDPEIPFFEFLSSVHYVKNSLFLKTDIGNCYFIASGQPNSHSYLDLADYIFMHTTFNGAVAENGMELPGTDPKIFSQVKGKIISGDIHVPQKLSRNIYYVGAPYRIRFGDSFIPRLFLIHDDGRFEDLHFATTNKWTIDLTSEDDFATVFDQYQGKIKSGDQVKVRLKVARRDYPELKELKQAIKEFVFEFGAELFGPEIYALEEKVNGGEKSEKLATPAYISNEETLRKYAEDKKLSSVFVDIGVELLK